MSIAYMDEEGKRRVLAAIVGAGYTIDSLSKALGVSRATLSSRVNGRTDFTKTEMENIARLVNKSPRVIFFTS